MSAPNAQRDCQHGQACYALQTNDHGFLTFLNTWFKWTLSSPDKSDAIVLASRYKSCPSHGGIGSPFTCGIKPLQ